MGTGTKIHCSRCCAAITVELKEVDIDEQRMLVSLTVPCPACGHTNKWSQLHADSAADRVVQESTLDLMAQITGLSKTKLKTYVYPPDVMKQADLARRKIPHIRVKNMLKEARQPYPAAAEDWWCVYLLAATQEAIWFNPDNGAYRIHTPTGQQILLTSVIALGEYYSARE
ncbi:hypothetical protein QWZ03_02955 [Chitinimonas viridis]|uniref:Uncharacterized protein n=1 Tax=Chitinimonas viridis TaxID=664880 RepID=A0ABT8B2L1_9NEIS|nr:hypothetical protein [Chitinimonas viridis]MDN3575729.1 hypothetical protein [Chitinimonas viridis]